MDEYPVEVFAYSNEMEAFYISLLGVEVGSDDYMSVLAHEYQHMIRFNEDRNESTWLNEGLSQLAERVAGYDTAFTHLNFMFDSRVQLNSWSEDFRESYSHYGASYLFSLYLWERFGDDVVRRIAAHPDEGIKAVDSVLKEEGSSVDEVFASWTVANYLDNPDLADGQYGYALEDLTPVCPRYRLAESARQPTREMGQYTANYIELEGDGEFTLSFRGDTEVGLVPTRSKSGNYIFWSNRGDGSTATLTRAFDLSQGDLTSATLQYWTWFDMQEGSDFGFVQVSTDGGETWKFIQATSMDEDIVTYNEGDPVVPHYTGTSGDTTIPGWRWEEADLTPYIGKEILLRFEYFTNITYTGYGWAIDTIRIPELDYLYEVEDPDDTWIEEGFVRTNNRLPQNWAIHLIEYVDGQPVVTPIEVYSNGIASFTVDVPRDVGRATVVIGAMAPTTKVPAKYTLTVQGGTMASLDEPPGVLYQDDFENPCGEFVSFILPDYQYGYKDGRYEIQIGLEEEGIWGIANQEYRNIIVEVDSYFDKPGKDTSMGIMCRYVDGWNFISFEIRNDGKYMVLGVDDGYIMEGTSDEWTDTDVLNTGEGAENHLKAVCNDKSLQFWINGELVFDTDIRMVWEGDIGLGAETREDKDIIVAFDNLTAIRP